MKVLITGAGGFLGIRVVQRLLAHGFRDLRCFLRDASKSARLEEIRAEAPQANVEYMVGNLKSRADTERAIEDVQLVFHLAATMKGAPADIFADSVLASRNLLDAIGTRQPMRVVVVSSFSVLGIVQAGRKAIIDERTPLEPYPERRDAYAFAKLRQEQLFRDYQKKNGFELVVLRPGVIYGSNGGHFSNRVGLQVGPLFLHLGGSNKLPLSYVDNCAEAVVIAGTSRKSAGETFNVHDTSLLTCRQYLRRYKQEVHDVLTVPVPYPILFLLSKLLERYAKYSKGQLPAVLTPYRVASVWAGNRFDNSKLRKTGWKELISTEEGLRRTFRAFRLQMGKTY